MAALNFPNSPSLNDTHTENGVTFKWNGAAWDRLGDIGAQGAAGAAGAQGAAGAAGAQGSTGPVAGSSSQVVYKDGSNNPAGSANFTFDGTNLSVGGNVSIGGILTYEDVTNIDSVGIITARAGVKVPDNQKIFLGTGDDLQIYHDGSVNRIRSDVLTVIEKNDSEDMASFMPDGAVVLFHNGSQKFETTSSGVKVSGSFPDFIIHDTDTTNDNFRILHNGGGTQLQVDPNNVGPNASHFIIGIDGTERLRIKSDGNLGVGNADPTQAKLVAQTTSGSSLAAIKDNTGASIVIGGVTQPRILMEAGASASELKIYTAGGSSYGSASWTERLRVTSGGNLQLYSGGNLQMASNGRIFVGNGGNATDPMFANVSDTNTGIAFPAADTMMFTTGGSERLRITSGGQVQIPGGTTPFHVTHTGGDCAQFHRGSKYLGINADWGGNTGDSVITASTNLVIHTNGSNERLRITSGGFVGINETSPSTHLHVEQDNAHSSTYYLNGDAAILVDNKNGSGKSVIKLEHDAAIVWGGSGDSILFSDRENERLRINEYGNTIFQGQAGSFSNGNAGNAAILVRGKSVSGSSTTVDLNISQSTSASGVGLEIQESTNNANALATLVFNHGSLKSMIGCGRVVTNNWGTDLRFYTHDDSTTGANQHKVYERMRIDSSGRLGINDSSPSSYLSVSRGTSDGVLSIFKNDEVSIQIGAWGTGSTYPRQCTINATRQDGGSYPWLRLAGQDGIHFCSDLNNIRGNLNAYGEWRIGVSNSNLLSTDQVHSIGGMNYGVTSNLARLMMQERQGNWIAFKDGSSNHYGTISRNGSGVSYGSNSDYRLKDNVQNFTSGIELVKRLRPVTFNWNALSGQEDTTTIHRGFLAHEVQEIEPGAVDGERDGMDRFGDCTNAEGVVTQKNVYESQAKDGETWTLVSEEIKDQQLDPAKLVPILTAGLKEAIAKIETLEAAVAALQGS